MSPLDCKEIQTVHPEGDQSWLFIRRTDAETETPYFGHLLQRTDSLEKTLMLGKIEGGRRSGWDGWISSPMQWTWVWVGSGSWYGQGGLVCCSPWCRKELDTTEQLNWPEAKWEGLFVLYFKLIESGNYRKLRLFYLI